MPRSILFALAVNLSCAASAPALAQQIADGEVRTRRVPHADLDLADAADVDELRRRIERAARIVCDDRPGPRPLALREDASACVAGGVDRLQSELDQRVALAEGAAGEAASRE